MISWSRGSGRLSVHTPSPNSSTIYTEAPCFHSSQGEWADISGMRTHRHALRPSQDPSVCDQLLQRPYPQPQALHSNAGVPFLTPTLQGPPAKRAPWGLSLSVLSVDRHTHCSHPQESWASVPDGPNLQTCLLSRAAEHSQRQREEPGWDISTPTAIRACQRCLRPLIRGLRRSASFAGNLIFAFTVLWSSGQGRSGDRKELKF